MRSRRRSTSVSPPQIPYRSPLAIAVFRQSDRTVQLAHTALA